MNKLTLDGQHRTGQYRADCTCGATWSDAITPEGILDCSPARAVAEAVVHCRMEHPGVLIDLQFTERFQSWLVVYWASLNANEARRLTAARKLRTP